MPILTLGSNSFKRSYLKKKKNSLFSQNLTEQAAASSALAKRTLTVVKDEFSST